MTELSQKIGFIGAGNMGQAMIGALINSKCSVPSHIFVSDIREDQTGSLKNSYGINVLSTNDDIVRECDIIIIAVKPQSIDQVLSDLSDDAISKNSFKKKLFISIAAGTPLKKIETLLYSSHDTDTKRKMPIMRVMPNTPALVLSGMSGVCANEYAAPEDMRTTKVILSAMGQVFECEEKDMDAVTAMSGSGPAYCFYLVEAMINAGIELGFDQKNAERLTLATLKGALVLLENQNESAEALRKKVTSPGGTTEAAIKHLDDHSVKLHITQAVIAAALRSKELSA